MNEQKRTFAPVVQEVIDDLMPIARKLAEGRGKYAISVGGSQGKGLSDGHSDVDFRLFHEKDLPWIDTNPDIWKDYFEAEARWKKKGINIDGIWSRKIAMIDASLNKILEGDPAPDDIIWTIWGYHILPDIHHQAILEDPYNIIADWKKRLSVYPPKLKKALLEKHLASVRYWRHDYHYQNKVKRGDMVFTAGLSSKLVHNLIQILFALNHTYYVGDGQNLDFIKKFSIAPLDFSGKVKAILYPTPSDTVFKDQYDALANLIDEVVQLAVEDENSKK
jgi:hypothetical protein